MNTVALSSTVLHPSTQSSHNSTAVSKVQGASKTKIHNHQARKLLKYEAELVRAARQIYELILFIRGNYDPRVDEEAVVTKRKTVDAENPYSIRVVTKAENELAMVSTIHE